MPHVIEPSFAHKTGVQCIHLALTQGNIERAWLNYLTLANDLKHPPSIELLTELLDQIDDALMSQEGLGHIDEHVEIEMTQESLKLESNKLFEKALSFFAMKLPKSTRYKLGQRARQVLRLHQCYGEPAHLKTTPSTGTLPNLVAVHIPHPSLPLHHAL